MKVLIAISMITQILFDLSYKCNNNINYISINHSIILYNFVFCDQAKLEIDLIVLGYGCLCWVSRTDSISMDPAI